MKLSKRTEYGLRAVVYLARLWPHKFIQSKDLAQEENLPAKFLEAILLSLRRSGFLESKVGSGGGYRLSRSPQTMRVGDVVRRLEGRFTVKDTSRRSEASSGEAAVRLINRKLTAATDEVLDKLSVEDLADLAARGRHPNQSMYYI